MLVEVLKKKKIPDLAPKVFCAMGNIIGSGTWSREGVEKQKGRGGGRGLEGQEGLEGGYVIFSKSKFLIIR
jgi:hypothetical protein